MPIEKKTGKKELSPWAQRLVDDKLKPYCHVIFVSEKNNDYKYLTATKIIEATLKYFLKSKSNSFDLRKRIPAKNLIGKAIKEDKRIAQYADDFFGYIDLRHREAHSSDVVLTKNELITLRKNIAEYLKWFFKEVLNSDFKVFLNELTKNPKIASVLNPEVVKSSKTTIQPKGKTTFERKQEQVLTPPKAEKSIVSQYDPTKSLWIEITDGSLFSRAYFSDQLLTGNEMRGCRSDIHATLSGLDLDMRLLDSQIEIANLSDGVLVKLNDQSIPKGKKMIIPPGKHLLSLNRAIFSLLIKTFTK